MSTNSIEEPNFHLKDNEKDINQDTNYANSKVIAPREAYYFFPQFNDEIDWNAQYPYQTRRFIFEKLSLKEYLPFEIEKYTQLKSSPLFTSIQLPYSWNQAMLMKCIQASKYLIPKTITLINKLISFEIPSLEYESYKEILESGFLYLHGLDSNYRPIIVTNASVYMKLSKRYSYEQFISAIDYFITYLCENIFIHGQVENWVMIADVNNITLLKPPISLMNVFSFISLKYLCRLSTLYIYGMSSVLSLCWSVIKKFLDEGTVKKFVFVNSGNKGEILSHVHPSQLEVKYGGTCPNRVGYKEVFYLPSEDYLTENKRTGKHLISEREYIDRAMEGRVIIISPYLKEEFESRRRMNNTLYSVALTWVNYNNTIQSDPQEESIKLIKEEENEIFIEQNFKQHLIEEKEDITSLKAKVKDEDYDTADLSVSHGTHLTISKKAKKREEGQPNNMITIFESKEETLGCYLHQTKGLCSCLIV